MERELYVKYIIIGVLKCEKKHNLFEKFQLKYNKEAYYQKLLERLPYNEHRITVMGKQGIQIELPMNVMELKELDKDYVESYIRKILDIYDIPGCYLCRELSFLNGRFNMDKKWIFQYLLFEEGILQLLDKCNIAKKDARFVIIDSNNKKVETILQVILEYANYITIVTNRIEYFQNAVDIVYEETGLMMDVVSMLTQKNIYGNVVINLDKECYRLYANFEENASVIDLEFTDRKLEYLTNRRKDLTILYDYDFLVGEQELNKELVAEIMVRDNWKISRFVKKRESTMTASDIRYIVKDYELSIKRIKTIAPS